MRLAWNKMKMSAPRATALRRLRVTAACALSVVVGVACGAETAIASCNVNADCASSICQSNGTCAPASVADAADGSFPTRWQTGDGAASGQDGAVASGSDGSGSAADTSLPTADVGVSDTGGQAGACKPNHDGTITASEAPYGPNLAATFRVAENTAVDLKGEIVAGGQRVWDFSGKMTGDQDVLVKTLPVKDLWFSSYYPGASYAAPMAPSGDLLGVFEANGKALLLRGVVSKDNSLFATRLVYDPPVPLLAFPLKIGAKWQVKASVSGLAKGVIVIYSESYGSEVDASGTVKTPFGDFPALRVRTLLTRQIGLLTTTVRSFLFATECFGTVAAARSKDGETSDEFETASELRRLTP